MRFAILSDIHGNELALRAVFADMEQIIWETNQSFDQVWCLGDVVGYGPSPSACVQLVRRRCDVCIAGNHDWAVIGKLDLQDFSGSAARSAEWTRDQLAPDERVYLRALPEVTRIGEFTLAHGSPSNPIWQYLLSPNDAAPNFAAFTTAFCVVGHTHVPTVFLQPAYEYVTSVPAINQAISERARLLTAPLDAPVWRPLETYGAFASSQDWGPCERIAPITGPWAPPPGFRAIINPGSVGQPRDGDARAAYLIYDDRAGFEFRRVEYDIAATQRAMREYSFPERLIQRLERGV